MKQNSLNSEAKMSDNMLNEIHRRDARELGSIIKKPIVDTVITSPPYFDMKDYGCKTQIGFGQTYNDYLADIKKVFSQVYDVTKNTGSLWVIIDTFKRDNEVVPLPFDFSNTIRSVGWKLQDIIIWGKNKTLPWANKGRTKGKFEYILFFTKEKEFKYYSDRAREYNTKYLKKWWIKYPERYNPKGKAPEGIWEYDIPTQGSWGNGYINHFCPLPVDMIARMINMTTDEGDIVLDPFSGTGAVLVQASRMNRRHIGFELNQSYIKQFKKYLKATRALEKKHRKILSNQSNTQRDFEKTILDLRSLKYARVLRNKLRKEDRENIKAVFVKKLKRRPTRKHAILCVRYDFLLMKGSNKEKFREVIAKKCSVAPLSRFGIEPTVYIHNRLGRFLSNYPKKLHFYSFTNTHHFTGTMEKGSISKKSKILSPIKLAINIDDYS